MRVALPTALSYSPVPSARPIQTRLRPLKALVGGLVGMQLMMGVVCATLMTRADRQYSDLVDDSVPVLHQLHTLTALASTTYAELSTDVASGARTPTALARVHELVQRERELRVAALNRPWLPGARTHAGAVEQSGAGFAAAAEQTLTLLSRGDQAGARTTFETGFAAANDRYLTALSAASGALTSEAASAFTRK